ncbi:MAG: hypothetical protein ABIP80_01225 [Ferruginibacter sp.]
MLYRCLAAFILLSMNAFAQPSDFIILKKKGRTVRSYYAGTQIEFMSGNGAYRNGLINSINHDTVYMQEFLVSRLPTTYGGYILDTAGSFRYKYHYNQILSVGQKPQKGFNVRGSGASLMGGGLILLMASGVVYVADKDKFSPVLMGSAAGLAGLGFLMNKSGSSGIVMGKKGYKIEYMDMTP